METAATPEEPSELEEKFTEFVGQTLYGSMLASMRKTLSKPAYMHGGRAEEVFQKQLDQVMVEELTEAADSIASPMFDLFNMQKRELMMTWIDRVEAYLDELEVSRRRIDSTDERHARRSDSTCETGFTVAVRP